MENKLNVQANNKMHSSAALPADSNFHASNKRWPNMNVVGVKLLTDWKLLFPIVWLTMSKHISTDASKFMYHTTSTKSCQI